MRCPWLGGFTTVHSLAFSLANSETQFCQRIENVFVFLEIIPMDQSQVEWCEKQSLSYWFTMRNITAIKLSTFASIWPVQSSTKQIFMEVKLQSEFVGWARKRARLVNYPFHSCLLLFLANELLPNWNILYREANPLGQALWSFPSF